MTLLRDIVRVELAILAACCGAAIVWRILRVAVQPESRRVLSSYFGGGVTGAIRLQLLVGSLAFAILYLASSLQLAGSGALPPVPNNALALLSCSQALFICVAAWRNLKRFGAGRTGEEK